MALALLTTMSMPPNFAAVCSIAALTDASSRTSTASGSAWPPAFSIVGGGGVDGAFELGMRLDRLGRDRNIGAVGGGLERDGEADAARAAGDEQASCP